MPMIICRDYMIRVCYRNPCRMLHKVVNCTKPSCNGNQFCKLVHLTEHEIHEINANIRPFRQTIYNEMKRLAFLFRETFPIELKTQTCTMYMLGECLWPCITCRTASNINNEPVCPKCYTLLNTQNIKALMCGHMYCNYCINQLSLQVDGPLPMFCCAKCNKWSTISSLF